MKIHLSKPGGQREGPFTVEEINRDLAARKYHDTDYWAWHEGLTNWVPLHSVPGICPGGSVAASPSHAAEPEQRPEPGDTVVVSHASARGKRVESPMEADSQETSGGTVVLACDTAAATAESSPEEPDTELEGQGSAPQPQLGSGMSFAALEQIFMLTTGEGQTASRSAVTAGMLEAVTGEEFTIIRQNVPRHVMIHCEFLEKMRGGGPIPEEAWRALARLNPDLVRQARQGLFRVCVRSFPLETGDMVSLFLFYNKHKL